MILFNILFNFIGAGLSINAIRAGATALALFEAAGAIGSGLQFGVGTGNIPPAYSDIVGYYNLCVGVGGLGLVAGQNLPKLGSWILKVKNSATTININRATALNFLKRLSSLKSSSLWATIKPTTKENLLKLANYLASKGLNATETILDPIFYTNLAKLATYNNLKKVAIIPLFVLLQKTDIDVTTGLIRNFDNAVESRIVLTEGGKIGISIETFTSASTFSTKPNIAGVINQTTETATGGLAKYSSVTDLESPAAWQSVSSSAVEMTQLSTTTHNIILLGSTTLGFVAFAQMKSSNDCDICVQPEREAICTTLKALHTKGGGTEVLKNKIRSKLVSHPPSTS